MTFVSYAQNFEDVMLWRALGHVEHGRYLDIGAQDPLVDSVSRAFYDAGWRGWHIEPTAMYSEALRQARPDETVLAAAIGMGELLRFHEFPETGLSTLDAEIAEHHAHDGFTGIERSVAVVSLAVVLDDMARDGDIHWMKIDVEGAEQAVLESWGDSLVRPWVLVIESTLPRSQAPSHESWEPLVLARGYLFAYFDGLNRFYVAKGHSELLDKFAVPPNVFDDFALNGTASQPFGLLLREEAHRHARDASLAGVEIQRLQVAVAERDAQVADKIADAQTRLLETIEFLRSENERREAALVEHRKQLDEIGNAESVERMRLLGTIEFLCGENERREAALADQRTQLELMGSAESAERMRLLEMTEFLRSENERREAVLSEQRRQLEALGNAGSAERVRLLETIEFLQAEHRKNQGQLTEANDSLSNLHARLANAEAFAKSAHDSFEQERSALGQTILKLRDEVRARSMEVDELQVYSDQLSHQLTVLGQDLVEHRAGLNANQTDLAGRLAEFELLRAQVHEAEAERLRLDQLLRETLASTSWRATAPLRSLKIVAVRRARGTFCVIFQLARKAAHRLRPVLRRVIQWNWLRRLVLTLVGEESRLTHHARLFLFGASDANEQEIVQNTDIDSLSGQARRVMRHINRVRAARGLPMFHGDREFIDGMDKQALRIYTNIQMLGERWRLGRK